MTSPNGYPLQGRLDEETSRNVFQKHFTTLPFKGFNRVGLDTIGGGYYEVATAVAVELGSDNITMVVTGHSMLKGDLIRFLTTVNPLIEMESFVGEVVDANTVKLYGPLSADLTAADTIEILRYISPKVAPDGSSLSTVNTGPVRIQRGPNGVFTPTEVTKDTADINNTIPMPVEIVAVDGTEVIINAGDIQIQSSRLGAGHDSMRIGNNDVELDYVDLGGGLGEAKVHDTDALAQLVLILAKIIAAPATEAKQDTSITALGSLLTELQLKADLTETQPVSIASAMPIPTGAATEAKQDANITAIGLLAKLSDTQPVSLASQPLPTGAATEATSAALLVELALKADLTETQPVSLATQPLPTGAATEAKQDDTITALDSLVLAGRELDNRAFALNDNSSANIVGTAGGTTVIADIGAQACTKIKITCTFGAYMELLINGVVKGIVPKGGFSDGYLEVAMPANAAIAFRSLGTTITTGEIVLNIMG